MIAAIAARLGSHAFAGLVGKGFERLRCDSVPEPIKRALCPLRVGAGLVADGLQLGHTRFEHRIGHIRNSVFDGIVEALEFGFRFGRTLAQFGDMRRSALGAVLPAVEHARRTR